MRLATIEDEYGARVRVTWKSFLLRPYPKEKSLEKFRAYTRSWEVPAGQPDAGRFRTWSTDEPAPSHSVPPNVAVKAAAGQGAFSRYHLALMDAYFYANRDVTRRQTIVDVAGECGLDLQAFSAALDDEATTRAVIDDHNEAVSRGVSGVPTVIVDGEFPIPGAQDLAFYRRVVDRRLAMAGHAS